MRTFHHLLAVACAAVSPFAFSQAEIVDSTPIGAGSTRPAVTNVQPSQSAIDQSEFYYQLQLLQEEVQQLRGIVDEQSHEIRRLKQQQLDDYVDLDRRLGQLSKNTGGSTVSAPAPVLSSSGNTQVVSSTEQNAVTASPEKELATYDKAVRLIIKEKALTDGAEAMKSYIAAYPNGVYVSNARYWVGQVSFIQGDLEDAKKWFGALIQQNPASQKAPEAKYKLGTVLHQLGETSKAKQLLEDAANSGGSVAQLAKDFLQENY